MHDAVQLALVPAAILLVVALAVAETRTARRAGRLPRTRLLVLAALVGVLLVFITATALLLAS